MIDGLIGGKLHGKPEQRTGKNGNPFVTAKVRAADGNGESLFVNVLAFAEKVRTALLALEEGDSVSLSGVLTPKAWINRDGEAKPALDMLAHTLTTAYHVTHKRQAMEDDKQSQASHTDF